MRWNALFLSGSCLYLIDVQVSGSVKSESSNTRLPSLVVKTFGQQITNRVRVAAEIKFFASCSGPDEPRAQSEFQGRAMIGIRGSSSSTYPKKPYRFEIQDE